MIVEIALLAARPGAEDQLREALRAARPVMARMPGYRGSVFHQGVKEPASFVLRIEWESLEAYEESFRQIALLTEWRGHFYHLLARAPHVMPYLPIAEG